MFSGCFQDKEGGFVVRESSQRGGYTVSVYTKTLRCFMSSHTACHQHRSQDKPFFLSFFFNICAFVCVCVSLCFCAQCYWWHQTLSDQENRQWPVLPGRETHLQLNPRRYPLPWTQRCRYTPWQSVRCSCCILHFSKELVVTDVCVCVCV